MTRLYLTLCMYFFLSCIGQLIKSDLLNEVKQSENAQQIGIETELAGLPLVISTALHSHPWALQQFRQANRAAWETLTATGNRLEAIVAGCTTCETLQCDFAVGYGGEPDDTGETTLDAMLMDGPGHKVGGVGQLRSVKEASKVAWAVLNYTRHTLLVGESDPTKSCGPYKPSKSLYFNDSLDIQSDMISSDNTTESNNTGKSFDTITMIVIDKNGDISGGSSTNGWLGKIHGRVGDTPIAGAGVYVDNDVGGASGTGDGDVMMRFLPSYQAVESMRQGSPPGEAARKAILRISKYYPEFSGALIAADKKGNHGAACHNIKGGFTYCVSNSKGVANVAKIACV